MLDITTFISEDGKIQDPGARRRLADVLSFRFAGRRARFRITEEKRTSAQNRFWWGAVVQTIFQAMLVTGSAQQVNAKTGEITTITPQDIHDSLKGDYLPRRVVEVFGQEKVLAPTTTNLSVTEFSDFINAVENDERVRRLLAYAGLEWPDPEQWQEQNGRFRSGKLAERMA